MNKLLNYTHFRIPNFVMSPKDFTYTEYKSLHPGGCFIFVSRWFHFKIREGEISAKIQINLS